VLILRKADPPPTTRNPASPARKRTQCFDAGPPRLAPGHKGDDPLNRRKLAIVTLLLTLMYFSATTPYGHRFPTISRTSRITGLLPCSESRRIGGDADQFLGGSSLCEGPQVLPGFSFFSLHLQHGEHRVVVQGKIDLAIFRCPRFVLGKDRPFILLSFRNFGRRRRSLWGPDDFV